MEYAILVLLLVLAGFLALIYKKLDTRRNEQEEFKKDLGVEREVKSSIENLNSKISSDLGKLNERLGVIDAAQRELTDLKTNVIDFKNLFNNKTERGQLGEEFLEKIVEDALQKKYYKFQHTLSNSKRVDCFLTLGSPHESISIDSKFSWENYTKMLEAKGNDEKKIHAKNFAEDINKQINDISEKYILDGETAPMALMFVASEGVFRVIESSPTNFVAKARSKNIVIVSPNTLWSFLKTYRLLIQNKEMYEQSTLIQKEIGLIYDDVTRFVDRVLSIDTRHSQISEDFKKLRTSMEKIQNRTQRVKDLDLEKKIGIKK
jgi:DNA recombination protein RmuC|tara:strand:- start:2318 stop:3274 length:957 start_codon:yes stop_codon:yes gene_type:complete